MTTLSQERERHASEEEAARKKQQDEEEKHNAKLTDVEQMLERSRQITAQLIKDNAAALAAKDVERQKQVFELMVRQEMLMACLTT